MTTNKMPSVYPAGDGGRCVDTLRLYTLIYVAVKGLDFFVHVSCKDMDIHTLKIDDLSMEFLTYKEMNGFVYPYDAELFSEIEDVAILQLKEIKEEEPISGAV